MTKGISIEYTELELNWIKLNCKLPRLIAYHQFCEKFNRNDVNFENYKALCLRNRWLTGRDGCFDKGIIPHNKGKEMPYNINSAKTQFKKGQCPHNTKPIGYERIDKKDGYIYVSIGKKRLVLKHKYLWEKENGKLPTGMALKCLDGNRQNTAPSNWVAISRSALPFLNKKQGYDYDAMPVELKPIILTLAKVKAAKSKINKK